MTKQKSTKRALLASGLALFMCISMFVGSTFAWFTDSVKTGVNTIQAGTLDIVLEYKDANGVWQDAEGKTLNFKAADNRTNILWEPGCTYELPAIRVRNNGNLALKYQLYINGTTGDAELLKAIDFTANDAVIDIFSGEFLTKDAVSNEIVIKGHMKETAGNEYMGLTIEGIGITVYATQFTYEKDSEDEKYDAGAYLPLVYTEEELASALEQGESVKLGGDITVTSHMTIPAGKTVNLVLNGKTITGTMPKTVGHLINNKGTLTVTGGTLTSAADNGGSALYNAAGATMTVENVTVNGAKFVAPSWPSYGINNFGELTINGAIINTYHGGVATGGDGVTVINNATIDVGQGTETNQTSWALYTYENGKMTVYDGLFENTKDEKGEVNGGGYLCAGGTQPIVIYGGTFSKTENDNNGKGILNNNYEIHGGTFDVDVAAFVADGCASIKNSDGTYTVYNSSSKLVLDDGAVLDLGGVAFPGTIVAEGDLTIKGDTKAKSLSATNGGTITIEDGKTLTLNGFSFGAKSNASAEYVITGGTVEASYGFFQHGTYELHSDFETGYMYYSFGSDITVYGTFHSQGKGDGLDYVRGKVTIANGGKTIHDRALWVGQPASWGAMNATLIVEEGGYVQAKSLSVYNGSELLIDAANAVAGDVTNVVCNSISAEGAIKAINNDALTATVSGNKIVLG